VPFIQEVNSIDKRVLEWDGNLAHCRPSPVLSTAARRTQCSVPPGRCFGQRDP
jgi:hypothetical protein